MDKSSETIQFLAKRLYKIDLDEFMDQTKFEDIDCNKISGMSNLKIFRISDGRGQGFKRRTQQEKERVWNENIQLSRIRCSQFINIYNITLDFIQFLKDEILSKWDKDILSAELVVYIFTWCINLYELYGSSFKMANSFQWITDCLVEIIYKFIIVSQDCDLFVKSKKWTSVYVLIELINSLISCYDRKSAKLESKNTDSTFKAVQKKDDKSSPKERMKTWMI